MAEQRGGAPITDPKVMRVLAHPARIAILEHLSSSGGEVVTATQCAEMVGLSPSATSYHLRELAKVGLVEQAPSRGDGRERLWRATASDFSVASATDEQEGVAAERALVEVYSTRAHERLLAWLARQHDEPAEWREVASVMSTLLLLDADELGRVMRDFRAVLEPYRKAERKTGVPAGARQVALQLSVVPID
ncbi:transcriptional regulator [Actinoplanes sp. N902-109]|uniref:ArsR/SmtB family transcription factor n=1 Tax=Actinoplanes sp. (strain N902-109) TaxID=649831 RepID=UPI0003295B6B|nr:winged helix-turn-helix domain-containing protein [Actinoplanes sp. N902-109]AGL13913.1 regulatory protein ArsR [Actinoplanes sp. N902-109]